MTSMALGYSTLKSLTKSVNAPIWIQDYCVGQAIVNKSLFAYTYTYRYKL